MAKATGAIITEKIIIIIEIIIEIITEVVVRETGDVEMVVAMMVVVTKEGLNA